MDRLEKAQNAIEQDAVMSCTAIYDLPNVRENLQKFSNLNELMGFLPEEIFLKAYNQKRFNLTFKKPFDYEPFSIFVHRYKSLKNCAKYIFIIEKLLGEALKNYNFKKERLKEMLLNSFADFGLFLIIADYCKKNKISILQLDPPVPRSSKKLDLKIKIKERDILVELFSPIEAMLKGTKAEFSISKEIIKHELKNINQPLIFVINTSDIYWCRNGLNRGCITDEMFYEIRRIDHFEKEIKDFPEVSAFLIKHADTLNVLINDSSSNPLLTEEIQVLTKRSWLQKIKRTMFAK